MTDIDRVFAQFRDESTAEKPRREVLNLRRRGAATGNRTVEVVRVRSAPAAPREQPPRSPSLRAAAWPDGFPVKPPAPVAHDTPPPATAQAVGHVMPAWQPSADPAPAAEAPMERARRPRKAATPATPAYADPFDPEDDGANCLRCGQRVQPGRERRGLMTCAGCG